MSVALLFFVVFGIGYYFLRESINPGYLGAVWINELGGRYGGTLDGHTGNIFYYLNEIVTWQFTPYMLLFPVAVLVGLKFSETKISRMVLFSVIVGGVFLVVISLAGTKLSWYDAQLFPYLAIITASLFYLLYTGIKGFLNQRTSYLTAALISMLCVLSFIAKPYCEIISKVYFPKCDFWDEKLSTSCLFFQEAVRGNVAVDAGKLLIDDSHGAITVLACYEYMMKERGFNVKVVDYNELNAGEKAIVFDRRFIDLLSKKYDLEMLGHIDKCNAECIYLKEKTGQKL